jgi:hypothetical protein
LSPIPQRPLTSRTRTEDHNAKGRPVTIGLVGLSEP